MNVNKDSWHYRLASEGSDYIKHDWYARYDRTLDFCTYARAVVMGWLKEAFMWGLVFLAALCVMEFFMWLVVSLMNTWFPLPLGAAIVLFTVALLMVCCAIGGVIYTAGKVTNTQPVREIYKAWKDKYCPLVNVESTPR